MERNAPRAVVSLLPLDPFCCGLMRLVAFASIPHHIRSMDKDIETRLKAFVTTLPRPLGQIPIERAIMRHPSDRLAGHLRACQKETYG
jgi:hypothetical protein